MGHASLNGPSFLQQSLRVARRPALLDFHERVLSQGAVPLPVLDEIIDEWIAEPQRSMPQH